MLRTHDPRTRTEVFGTDGWAVFQPSLREAGTGAGALRRSQVEDKMWINDALAALSARIPERRKILLSAS